MLRIIFTFFILLTTLYSIELDVKTLQEIVDNDSSAINERLLLAKYYEKNENNLKALTLVDEVLQIDAKNSSALAIKDEIATKERVKGVFREAGLTTPVESDEAQKRLDSYYSANNYQFYSNLYQALVDTNVELDDSYHIKAAYIYLWDARYKESESALNELHHENNIDAAKIRADICYYTGKYKCSARLYEKLYNSSYEIKIAIKLINSYIYLGETTKAQRLYNFIYRKYPKNKELQKAGQKIDNAKNSYLLSMKKAYEDDKNIETLSAYANALYAAGKKDETLELIHEYNKTSATNKSLILEVKYLTWMGKTEKALEILKHGELNKDLDAKLILGQIYSWDHKFDEAKRNLNEVIKNSKDKEQVYNARKALAFVYLWDKKSDKSKELFTALQKEKPADREVREALMELNHDYAGLIKIYKGRSSPSDRKRLSELYQLNKQPDKAIEYLQEYVNEQPTDLEATKNLALLLIEKKDYYQGFGYLEYYAAQKQSAESSILLAKNYYWQGFSKEALDVLEKLLKKEPENKEALKLKAKILKVAPRFTTSNSGATTGTYFDDLGKKQLFIADTLYFNTHYKASIDYYKNYLQLHPNDHEARYRYAFALENTKKYGEAEGEFSIMFWTKDSDELRYHYAYNMMKNGKLKESEKLLLKLKESVYKKLDSNMSSFLDSWKTSWESLKFQEYASHYSEKYLKDEMWSYRKQEKFSKVNYITVGVYDPVYKKIGENSYRIKFYQEYTSNKNADKGYKTLDVECASHELECKIIDEKWSEGEYEKELLLMPYIDKSLEENRYLQEHPISMNTKKKSLYHKRSQQNITIYT
jgi:tetratricopeptide (TPR) repeat protein